MTPPLLTPAAVAHALDWPDGPPATDDVLTLLQAARIDGQPLTDRQWRLLEEAPLSAVYETLCRREAEAAAEVERLTGRSA